VAVPSGSLSLTGIAPTKTNTTPPPSEQLPIPEGVLGLAGHGPTLDYSWTVHPGAGSISLTGYDFTYDLEIPVPTTSALALSGQVPSLYFSQDVGQLALSGQVPKLTILPNVTAGEPGSLTLDGRVPAVTVKHGGGVGVSRREIKLREVAARRKALDSVQKKKDELAELFPTEAELEKLAKKGKATVAGVEVEVTPIRPVVRNPINPAAPQLAEIKSKVDREIAKILRAQALREAEEERLAEEKRLKEQLNRQVVAFLLMAVD
jgi:hypothetical protein